MQLSKTRTVTSSGLFRHPNRAGGSGAAQQPALAAGRRQVWGGFSRAMAPTRLSGSVRRTWLNRALHLPVAALRLLRVQALAAATAGEIVHYAATLLRGSEADSWARTQ